MERAKRSKEGATLNRNAQERLVRRLNLNLASMTSLATAYKQAHWNLQGPGFAQLHELFDRFADQTREYADLVAERTVQLLGTSHGTIEGAVKETNRAFGYQVGIFPRLVREAVEQFMQLSESRSLQVPVGLLIGGRQGRHAR